MCRHPVLPGHFPVHLLDFCCPGPDKNEDVNADENGKEEPHEDAETQQKIELFVKTSFEAKDELFPEKANVLEELPADVNTEIEDQDPEGVLPAEAPKPTTLGATSEGNVVIGPQKHQKRYYQTVP